MTQVTHHLHQRYLLIVLPCFITPGVFSAEPNCLYVSSYHQGYHWNDRIEAGLQKSLGDHCLLKPFYMDTKRNKEKSFAQLQAEKAYQLIRQTKPDIVIACDDNASKYLVVPYLANTAIPVVFCGVNWSVEAYGYPYPNVTGMIEVAPMRPLIRKSMQIQKTARKLGFISSDVPTQHKEVHRLEKIAADENIELISILVSSFDDWQQKFLEIQQEADIIILGNPAGINDWNQDKAKYYIAENTRQLTVSFGVAMSRHAVFSMTNIPEEQGEWSGELAKQILSGVPPAELPITPNRRWNIIANPGLAKKLGIKLPESVLQGAEITGTNGS